LTLFNPLIIVLEKTSENRTASKTHLALILQIQNGSGGLGVGNNSLSGGRAVLLK
jgi:hypothetical protein